MLRWLRLKNFRGFENHTIPFREVTIAAGRNNAGKSSFIEALRLVSIVSNRCDSLTYKAPPDWVGDASIPFGASIDIKNLHLDFESICYEYRPGLAEIEAEFEDGKKIQIFLSSEGKIHAVLMDKRGRAARTKSEARSLKLPTVGILPQISPLAREEKLLKAETIHGAIDSPLASSHFRNQLYLLRDHFDDFCTLAEEKWPGLQVREIIRHGEFVGDPIFLQMRCDEFVGEVGKMGHGLQMWLQCIWFLCRCKNHDTLILDEPDVYMHADLQRRLIKYLLTCNRQIVIATHSVEIISEVEPENLLIIERKAKESKFADSVPAVQRLMEFVGSIQNIHFARMWNSRRFILVEGDDVKILKHLHRTLYPLSIYSLDAIPNMAIGGWNGWSWAIGSSMAMKNAFGESIVTYCILDHDYHLEEEVQTRYTQAKEKKLQLHVWRKKELENYLLSSSAIARLINTRQKDKYVTEEEVAQKVAEVAEQFQDDALDALTDEFHKSGYKGGGASKKARAVLKERVKAEGGYSGCVCGKDVISRLSVWAHANFGTPISAMALANELHSHEIDHEVMAVLEAIEEGKTFR